MGLVTKKHNELGTLDETRPNRNSYHLRGQSHGSALRNGVRASDSCASKSPNRGELQRGMFGIRLASLPEQKREVSLSDDLSEIARGTLYSLNILFSLISTLATVTNKDGKMKRSSIEKDLCSTAIHIDHLDKELLQMDSTPGPQLSSKGYSRRSIAQVTGESATVFQRMTALLIRITKEFVKDVDSKYFRTLLLTLYGSVNEMCNASKLYVDKRFAIMMQRNIQQISTVSTISESSNEGGNIYISDRSITPTQRRKPERRWKNGSIIQQPVNYPSLPTPGAQTAILLHSNGRSRSNSRAAPFHGSTSSSVVNTPRSGESFSSSNFVARSRSGSVNVTSEQVRAEKQETAQFEQTFIILGKSVDEGLMIIPHLESDFYRALDAADKQYADPGVRDQWVILADSTTHCLRMTEALKTALSSVRLNDREARNARGFWQLAKGFLDSYGTLLVAIKEAIKHNLVDPNMKYQLRAVHTSTREATRLIATSPWNRLTFDADLQATPQAPTQLKIQHPAQSTFQHRTRGSGGSAAGSSSPYPTNVPATPLSAALGPAAQATVPAALTNSQIPVPPPTAGSVMPPTPGTASLERSFEGDIFQRAETYQSLQQTMIPRRQVI